MTQNKILRLATAQTTVEKDIQKNGATIRKMIEQARRENVDLVHFCEGALSGYVKSQIESFENFNWEMLNEELLLIQNLCKKLGIWAVIGSCHYLSDSNRPRNSLYIIDSNGHLHDRYDKRFCSHSEITNWFSAGDQQVIFQIKGFSIGCAICIEIQFPEIFLNYEKDNVDCVLFSSYSDSRMFGIQAQGHAACNNYWISMSIPTDKSLNLPSNIIGPNGEVSLKCQPGVDNIVIYELNPNDKEWNTPIKLARPWRRIARKGDIYRDHK